MAGRLEGAEFRASEPKGEEVPVGGGVSAFALTPSAQAGAFTPGFTPSQIRREESGLAFLPSAVPARLRAEPAAGVVDLAAY